MFIALLLRHYIDKVKARDLYTIKVKGPCVYCCPTFHSNIISIQVKIKMALIKIDIHSVLTTIHTVCNTLSI